MNGLSSNSGNYEYFIIFNEYLLDDAILYIVLMKLCIINKPKLSIYYRTQTWLLV